MSAKKSYLGILIKMLIDTVLPPRCFVTGRIVQENGTVSPELWRNLSFISKPFCQQCGVPFQFLSEDNINTDYRCGRCIETKPSFDQSRAAVVYNDDSRSMILTFKHGDQCHASLTFARWMATAGADILEKSDIIAPVPLHRWRLWRRRYNQAALLAQAIVKEIRPTAKDSVGQPKLLLNLLCRHRATMSQGYMNQKQRKLNVTGAFLLNSRYKDIIQGKNILLVDDVLTTGSTLQACAEILKKKGAQEVYTLCLARVVR